MKRSIVIFCGPGRAGSTFVQKLLESNRNYLIKNNIYLPIIKETYIGTLEEISSKVLKKLYNLNQSGIYLDFSNLFYKSIFKNKLLSFFDDVTYIVFRRDEFDWLQSLLLFEIRKGKKIDQDLFLEKSYEIDLLNFGIDQSVIFFDFNWIKLKDKSSINLFFQKILNIRLEKIEFEVINESIVPKHRLIGVFTKSFARYLRRKQFFKILEGLKEIQFIRFWLFKKPKEHDLKKIKTLLNNNFELIEKIKSRNNSIK